MLNNRRIDIQKLKKSLSNGLSRKGKAIILSIIMSLIIGSIFGVISLQMADKDSGMTIESTKQTVDVSNQQGDTNLTTHSPEPISFYVVQAGVFSEEANAKERIELFKEAGYSNVIWKKEQEIYLLTGISVSKDEIKKLANEMQDEDFDVFVKKWEVKTAEQDIQTQAATYLDAFLSAWNQSLEDQNNQALTSFIKDNSDEISQDLQPLQKQLIKLIQSEEKDEQEILLESMYMYENYVNKDSK
ncbi:MAG TPA: SPOR domain-containing protein [Pseudogracilibacillus sp.]|nr:SPOR domain-containing protein [Pseudogracilibacillus sp.]